MMMGEMQRLSVENDALKQQASSAASSSATPMAGTVAQMEQQIVKAMDAMAEKIGGMSRPRGTLMDVKGLGKPVPFNN